MFKYCDKTYSAGKDIIWAATEKKASANSAVGELHSCLAAPWLSSKQKNALCMFYRTDLWDYIPQCDMMQWIQKIYHVMVSVLACS